MTTLLAVEFIVRGRCGGGWPPGLIALELGGEIVTFLAYTVISVLLGGFIRKRHVRRLQPLFGLMACFFMGCGLTHLMNAVTFFWPIYWAQAWVIAATAVVSALAAGMLVPLTPWVMRFPSVGGLRDLNASLREEVYSLQERMARLATQDRTQAVRLLANVLKTVRATAPVPGTEELLIP